MIDKPPERGTVIQREGPAGIAKPVASGVVGRMPVVVEAKKK